MMRLKNDWRAGYAETCTSGSEGGSEKPGLATDQGAWFLPYKSTSATNIALGLVKYPFSEDQCLRMLGRRRPLAAA